MTTVKLEYLDGEGKPTGTETITTTADSVFVFDDIANHVHAEDEFGSVPEGTKKIVITIDCDF